MTQLEKTPENWSEFEKQVAKQLDRIERNQPILSIALFIGGLSVSTTFFAASVFERNPVLSLSATSLGYFCLAVSVYILLKYKKQAKGNE